MQQWTIGKKLFTAIGAICFVLATAPGSRLTAEEQIPLADTGTYGSF